MKININNRQAIEKAIKQAEKGTSARHINYDEILFLVNDAKNMLKNIPLKYQTGCKCYNEIKLTNSYKNKGLFTCVVIERFPSGWFMVYCQRDIAGNTPYGSEKRFLLYGEKTKEYLINRMNDRIEY